MTAGIQGDTTLRNAMMDAITTRVGNAGLCRIYTGTKPASCASALSGNTLLAELTCGSPFAPAASGGVLSPTLPSSANAVATGTASFYREYKADGTTCVLQDDVVSAGSGLVLNPSSNVITVLQPVVPTFWTYTAPGA